MIVKFLAKSKTFKGVRYNTNKVEKDKGELMKVSGFGPLQGLSHLMPQDYINYLQMVSAHSKRTRYPQLHAVISAKGKDTSKEELTEIADKWMKQMGYANQPYLVTFHKDTRNHHVHIVSTRVDKATGKKISSAYEKLRAMTAINRIMKQDEKLLAKADLEKALSFNFQTKAQFMMILESKGYTLIEGHGKMSLIKFGKNLSEVDLAFLKERKVNYQLNQKRANEITAFIHKYKKEHSTALRPITEHLPGGSEQKKHGYTSDLAEELHRLFGIKLIFHSATGKPPYGYSVLDHADKNVFKGGEIIDLSELLSEKVQNTSDVSSDRIVHHTEQNEELSISTVHLHINSATKQITGEQSFEPFEQPLQISIADDIDDEQIHGRNRHRKRQARTNTR